MWTGRKAGGAPLPAFYMETWSGLYEVEALRQLGWMEGAHFVREESADQESDEAENGIIKLKIKGDA